MVHELILHFCSTTHTNWHPSRAHYIYNTELYFSEKIFPCDTVPLISVAKWQMKMKTFLVNPVFYPEEKDIVKIG